MNEQPGATPQHGPTIGAQAGPGSIASLLTAADQRFRPVTDGTVSAVYPALAEVSPDLFGIAVVGIDGTVDEVGDSRSEFALMSCAKPFVFALVSQALGLDEVRRRVGVNATGLPFNSLAAVERDPSGRTNPMVNAGALATTSLVPGGTEAERWAFVAEGLSAFVGHDVRMHEPMLASASATNHRNRALAYLLHDRGALASDPAVTTDLYTRTSCLLVSAMDLALMGATLANAGVSPVTGIRVVGATVARATVVMMAIAGLYETSGDWLLDVGLPGKSGIGGGILTVSPGRGGLGTFSPPLDAAGNSVRGSLVAAHLSAALGLDLFTVPATMPPDAADG